MRIIVFTTAYDPLIGGAELALQNIIERQPNHHFDIITKRHRKDLPKFEDKGHIHIHRVGFGIPLDKHLFILLLLAPLKAWSLIKKGRKDNKGKLGGYDFSWSMMANQAGISAWLTNRLFKLPYLLTLQEGDSEDWVKRRATIFGPVYSAIYRRASHIQAISEYLLKRALHFDSPAPKSLIPNGIDLNKFKPVSPHQKNLLRDELGLPKDKQIVVTTSRLVVKNAVDILIKSFAYIDDLFLLVVGDGPDRSELENLVAKMNIGHKVKLVGEVSFSNLEKYLQVSDIFVRPSRSEGLGTSFIEAMAVGLPIIGTPVGGIPDILKSGYNGLFCKVDDPKDLSEQILRLSTDRNLYENLAGNAFAESQKFSWNEIAKKMNKIYENLLHKKTKVLMATGIFPPDMGGPASYTAKISPILKNKGFGVGIVTYANEGAKELFEDSIVLYKVKRIKNKVLQYFKYFWLVFKIVPYYDKVYLHDIVSAGLPVMLACKLRRKKYIVKIVGDYAWEQGQQRFDVKEILDNFKPENYGWQVKLLRRIEKKVADNASLIITPSKYLKERILTWGTTTEIKVIYNAIEVEKALSKEQARKKLNLSGTIVTTVARLVPWKGIDTLISIVPKIKSQLPDLKFLIIGSGPDYNKLQAMIVENGVSDSVEIIGAMGREKYLEYLQASDVLVLNTSYEGLSHVLVEALCTKVPVVASNMGGNPEVVINGETGLLFEYNNEEEIIEKLTEILTNRTLREIIIARGQEFSKERFGFENMISETINVLDND